MDKRKLLVKLAVERARLMHELLGLSADELETLRVCGEWSSRDALAHVAAWEKHACDAARYLRARQPVPPTPDTADEDAYNARAVAVWRAKPLTELLDALAIAHRQLTVTIAGCSQAQLDWKTEGRWSITDHVSAIIAHDVEHTAQIRAARGARPPRADDCGPKVLLQHALTICRSALMTLIDVVPTDQRESLPVNGVWTLKDALGHLADWDAVTVEGTLAMEANQRITWEPLDYGEPWNQSHAAPRREQSWARVWRDFVDTRGTVVTELAERVLEPDLARTLPAPWKAEVSFYVWLAVPCRHDVEHSESLLAWYNA